METSLQVLDLVQPVSGMSQELICAVFRGPSCLWLHGSKPCL